MAFGRKDSTPQTNTGLQSQQPSGTGLGTGLGMTTSSLKKDNEKTDNSSLVKTIDGDLFNVTMPPAVGNPIISIPGVGLNGKLTHLDFNEKMLSTHMAMIGGIGNGKSNTFYHLIAQIRTRMSKDDLMIVFDTKGDFLRRFGKPGDIVISNDERSQGLRGIDYWNIFEEIDPADPRNSVREICSSLFKEAVEGSSNSFFPNAAADVLYALVLILYTHFEKANNRKPTNKDLIDFIKRSSSAKILETITKLGGTEFMSIANHISDPKSGQTQGVIAELSSVVNRIFVGNFAKNGSIGICNLVKNKGGKCIFIEYDIMTGEVLSPIYSLLVDLALKQAMSNKMEHTGSVYLFVDEFKLLPNLSHIDDAVNFGRSLGVKVFIALQAITQLYDGYGELRGKSIMSGFLNCMFFNVNNPESREFMKERFGKCLRRVVYDQNKDHVFEDYVVKDKDITRLQVGEAIVGLNNCEPFKFRSLEWKKD